MCAPDGFVEAAPVFAACGFVIAEFAELVGFADATALSSAEGIAGSDVAVTGGAAVDVATVVAPTFGCPAGSVAMAGATVCVTAGDVATTVRRAKCAYHAKQSTSPAPNPQTTAMTAPLPRRGRAGGGTDP